MRFALSCAALALAAAPGLCQSNTWPAGLDTTEGNAAFAHWASTTGRSLQGVDNTHAGQPRAINHLSWRRNGTGGSGARTMDVQLTVAETPFSIVSTVFQTNLRTNKRVVVPWTTVNFPDWSAAPSPPPAKFDFTLKFNSTWVYRGLGAFVWLVEYRNSSSTASSSTDRDYTAARTANSSAVGTGCGGFAYTGRLENNGPALPNYGMRFKYAGTSGPANAATFLMIDGKDSNLAVPGLCTRLHAFPTVLVPIDPTDASGAVATASFSFPYIAGLENQTLVSQLLSFDPSQSGLPFRLSNALTGSMPASTATTGHEACYLWNTLGNQSAISLLTFFGGSVIVEGVQR